MTFRQAHNAYQSLNDLQSAHTLQAYLRAIDLFLRYLGDRSFTPQLPIQAQGRPVEGLPLSNLTPQDERLLRHYAAWLQTDDEDDPRRPYSAATIELRLAGIVGWFRFLEAQGWLPDGFSLEQAIKHLNEYRQYISLPQDEDKAVSLDVDLSPLFSYYATQSPPSNLRENQARWVRWELTRLRNHALIQVLAETGGQISATLDITLPVFESSGQVVDIRMLGKNNHTYTIELKASLGAVRHYIRERRRLASHLETELLFISHDARYEGNQMSRVIAWRIIQRAAKAVGLPKVSPHDLRHWCAKHLIETGHSLHDVKEQLGHRSIHTVRVYYGHWLKDTDAPASDD